MSHRSREAQALLDAARPDEDPGDDDRARIRGAVFARIGAAAAATAITTTAAQAGAGAVTAGAGAGLAGKVIIGLLVVAGLGGGAVAVGAGGPRMAEAPARAAVASWARIAAEPARAAAVAASAAGVAAPAEDTPEPPGAESGAEQKAAPTASGGSGSGSRKASAGSGGATEAAPDGAAAPAKRSELDAESALLRRAQTELSAGRTDEALRLLAEHERSFADGTLREERAAGRVLALCQAGKVTEARALAEQFLRDNPASPLAGRVRGACAQK